MLLMRLTDVQIAMLFSHYTNTHHLNSVEIKQIREALNEAEGPVLDALLLLLSKPGVNHGNSGSN
jgi:hypothetical protein